MAEFQSFQENEPVIILGEDSTGKKDTNQKDIYKRTCIMDGSEAKPDIFNVGIMDSINRDVSLENALTYMARCGTLYTSSNTKFLSHCEGEGKDIIGNIPVVTSLLDRTNLFVTDDTFLGAAYPTGHVENIIQEKTETQGVVDSRFPRKTPGNGWTYTLGGGLVEGTTVLISEVGGQSPYLLLTTNTGSATPPAAGAVYFKTEKIPLRIPSTNLVPSKFSIGINMSTEDNMADTETSVLFRIKIFEGNASETTPIKTVEKEISNYASYNGVIDITSIDGYENLYNPYFTVEIDTNFLSTTTFCTIRLSKLMAQDGEHVSPYTVNTRDGSYGQYNNIVDLTALQDATVVCWAHFDKYSIQNLSEKGITPISINWDKSLSISLAHLNADGINNANLRLVINDFGIETISEEVIEIPEAYFDSYLFTALRFHPVQKNNNDGKDPEFYYRIEGAVALNNKVQSVSLEVPASYFANSKGAIIIGHDVPLDAELLPAKLDFFNGKVSEIRYDEEWLNNLELYIMSLGKKAFSYRQSTDSQVTTHTPTPTEILDAAGINLIQNPTGRYGFIHWNNFDISGLDVSHTNSRLGNSFTYYGSPSTDVILYSEQILVSTNTMYTFRAVMCSGADNTGDVGIGIRWLKQNETFDKNQPIDQDTRAQVVHNGKVAYYKIQEVSPTNAVTCVVYMYVKAESEIGGIGMGWSKLKLEQGSETFFTDDCGADYALYY